MLIAGVRFCFRIDIVTCKCCNCACSVVVSWCVNYMDCIYINDATIIAAPVKAMGACSKDSQLPQLQVVPASDHDLNFSFIWYICFNMSDSNA